VWSFFSVVTVRKSVSLCKSSLAEQLTELRLENEQIQTVEEDKEFDKVLSKLSIEDEQVETNDKQENKELDVSSLAAAVAAVAALGVIVPATDLELAALAAASAGYAISRNDTNLSGLVRSLGRLGESTVRMGLDVAFPKNQKSSLQAAVVATSRGGYRDLAEDDVLNDMTLPPAKSFTEKQIPTKKNVPRIPRPREAITICEEARIELERIASLERELRERETQLRAALATKPRPAPKAPPGLLDQSPRLEKALEGLANLRTATRMIEQESATKEKLNIQLQQLEQQFRARQVELRTAIYDVRAHSESRQRIQNALNNVQEELNLLTKRRGAARERLARASAILLTSFS